MLTEQDIPEQLSNAYIHAVAARAGFAWERTSVDRDGVDGYVMARGHLDDRSVLRSPMVGLQLKATSTLGDDADGKLAFALKQKNYDDLRGRCATPRYLALLRLPSDPSTWLSVGPDALVLRRCMYWCSLREAPANMNERSTTIHVPISQVLDPGELGRLVAAAAREEAL